MDAAINLAGSARKRPADKPGANSDNNRTDMSTKTNGKPAVKSAPFVEKMVRHTFSAEERLNIGGDLARAIASQRNLVSEFDQVKASYKAKTSEADAKVDSLSTAIVNGFEMRTKRCAVILLPEQRKKHFIPEEDWNEIGADAEPALVEDMSKEDFQQALNFAEAQFEQRESIELFPPAKEDRGELVVGRFEGKWYTALRISVGNCKLAEVLNAEQRGFKEREDAVNKGAKVAQEWLTEQLGKESAEGFKGPILDAVEKQKGRAE